MNDTVDKVQGIAIDIAERVVSAYIIALIALVSAGEADVLNIGFWKASLLAAFPAALEALRGAISRLVGDPNSASLLK